MSPSPDAQATPSTTLLPPKFGRVAPGMSARVMSAPQSSVKSDPTVLIALYERKGGDHCSDTEGWLSERPLGVGFFFARRPRHPCPAKTDMRG